MNQPLQAPYDADKVSILVKRLDGDYDLAAVLTRPAFYNNPSQRDAWAEIVAGVADLYGGQPWARDDAPPLLSAAEVVPPVERLHLLPQRGRISPGFVRFLRSRMAGRSQGGLVPAPGSPSLANLALPSDFTLPSSSKR